MTTKHVSKKELQKSFHLKGSAKDKGKGCVTKCFDGSKFDDDHHANYRFHGYQETKSNAAKSKRYEPTKQRVNALGLVPELLHGMSTPTKRKPRDPFNDPAGWKFVATPNANGHVNYKNANVPFPHQYHHMVPWETLGSGLFTTADLKLIQKSGYCLHHGFNLIILPMRNRVAEVLRMHTHPNNHKDYNFELEKEIFNIKAALGLGDPDVHLTEDTATVLKDTLENWEKDEWAEIMKSGEKRFPEHVNEHTPSCMCDAFERACS